MSLISTPCVNVCRINSQTGLCEGCLRTSGEIGAWARMPEVQRIQVMQELEQRKVPVVKR